MPVLYYYIIFSHFLPKTGPLQWEIGTNKTGGNICQKFIKKAWMPY